MNRIYWFWHSRFPVTIHLDRDYRYDWTRMIGIRIGSWFIGGIHGYNAPAPAQETER